MSKKFDHIDFIRKKSNSIFSIHTPTIHFYDSLRSALSQIDDEKNKLTRNSVQFMLGRLLTRQYKPREKFRKGFFDIYVIGDFSNYFTPVESVADILADFYLQIGIMPNIVSIPTERIESNIPRFQERVRYSLLLYDRKRRLY